MRVHEKSSPVASTRERDPRSGLFAGRAGPIGLPREALALTLALALFGSGGSELRAAPPQDFLPSGGAVSSSESIEGLSGPVVESDPDRIAPPTHYAVTLTRTSQTSGLGRASGLGEVYFPPSPFGMTLTQNGSYLYQLRLTVEGLPPREGAEYVAWATTPTLDRIDRLGTVPESGTLNGELRWNKFLLLVTLEPEGPLTHEGLEGLGPIVLRGMSRSGKMHPMAGHDPFVDREGCAQYGFEAVHCR